MGGNIMSGEENALRYRRTMKMLPRNSGRQLSVEYTVYFGFTRLYYFCVLLDL